jgi:hypothetical protein
MDNAEGRMVAARFHTSRDGGASVRYSSRLDAGAMDKLLAPAWALFRSIFGGACDVCCTLSVMCVPPLTLN